MAGDLLRIDVDQGDVTSRVFTQLEQRQLPFVLLQTVNRVADDMKDAWRSNMAASFDRPTSFTLNSVFVQKARYQRGSGIGDVAAVVGIKDFGGKGTPASRYLEAQVFGGARSAKGLEAGLRRIGVLGGSERAVPAQGAQLNGFGNIKGGVVQQILSQLGANREVGSLSNETDASKKRKSANARRFFVVRGNGGRGWVKNRDGSTRGSHLHAGIYQRVGKYRLRSIFAFVRSATYKKRFDIFGIAQKVYSRRFPFYFDREMAKALETARIRGKA